MARKRLAAEQIVTKLRQIEVLQGQGKTIAMACKEAGTTEHGEECLTGETCNGRGGDHGGMRDRTGWSFSGV